MKAVRIASLTIACAGVFGIAANAEPAQSGRGPAVPSCATLSCDVQGDWERTKTLVLWLVNAMPDDKWGYKPTPAQQSFVERALHIADIDIKLFSTLGGKTPPPAAVNLKATTKAEAVAALQASFDYGSAVLKEFDDQKLAERIASRRDE